LLKQWTTYQDTQLNLAPTFQTDGIIYRPWNFVSIGEKAAKFRSITESSIWHFDNTPTQVIYNFNQVFKVWGDGSIITGQNSLSESIVPIRKGNN
jgi:hypothetical protein